MTLILVILKNREVFGNVIVFVKSKILIIKKVLIKPFNYKIKQIFYGLNIDDKFYGDLYKPKEIVHNLANIK